MIGERCRTLAARTRYALETDDGALIYIQTRGVRHGPSEVPAEYETSSDRYRWLNRTLAVGSGMRLGNAVIYDAYVVR
jgi:hypothetical protein